MKDLNAVNALLEKFESTYGVNAKGAFQGQEDWFKLKLGVISASNASKVVAGEKTETRATYMASLIGQVCTGQMTLISSPHLDWGNDNEDPARAYYELTTGRKLTELPFVFKDETFRCGVSPDFFSNDGRDVEIKCPSNTENHVKFLMSDKIKSEYLWQLNFNMWVRGTEAIDFCSYDPRMNVKPLAIKTIEKDPEKFKKFEDLVPKFIEDMDKHLAEIGMSFGQQWKPEQLESMGA